MTRALGAAPRGLRLGALLVSILSGGALSAHTPHDIVRRVRLSPTFERDRTLLALVMLSDQQLVARSDDAGRSFRQFATPFSQDGQTRFAFSPRFADDGTAFAASPFHGLFTSEDAGRTWRAVAGGPSTPLDVEASPRFEDDRTLLVGTARGAFRSTDGGATWSASPGDRWAGKYVRAVRFAPDGGGRIALVAARERREEGGLGTTLLRTDDGGASWRAVGALPAPIADLAISSRFTEDGTLMACFGPRGRGALVSVDGGRSFRPARDGLPDRHVNDVEIADDGTVFAVTKEGGTFRAPRAGDAWTRCSAGFEELTHQTDDHAVALAVSPAFPEDGTVFVGMFEGLFRSVDRGDRFEPLDLYGPRVIRALSVAPTFAEEPHVFVGSYGAGALVSEDGGATWADRSNGLETLYTSLLVPAPTYADGGPLFFGHQGLWRSDDLGRSWRDVGPERRYGIPRALGFSPTFDADGVAFLNAGRGSFRTVDGGETWTEMPDLGRGRTMSVAAVSPGFPDDGTAYMASKKDGLWRTTDGGDSWAPLHDRFARAQVRAFALSPTFAEDGLMLAGTPDGLFVSDDRGATWSSAHGGLPEDGGATVQAIVFSPAFAEDRVAFVSTQRHGVHRSSDGGRTWSAANAGLPRDCPRALVISPAFEQDRTLYLATHDWVWRTRDAGASWSRLSGRVRLDDDHPSLRYEGLWGPAGADDACGQGVTATASPGATVALTFEGEAIEWWARRGPDGGVARVELDGREAATVDLRAETITGAEAVFRRRFDAPGFRSVRVVAVAREGEGGDVIRSDGFAYEF
ncbi:MAG: WD40/YVTN/BNR-like repeat-containing protein [Planctomycetota bacterium JB042]